MIVRRKLIPEEKRSQLVNRNSTHWVSFTHYHGRDIYDSNVYECTPNTLKSCYNDAFETITGWIKNDSRHN